MDAELFKQIKTLAAKLNKDKNDLLEEAAQDLIKKYNNQEPSLSFSDQIWGFVLIAFIWIAISLIFLVCVGLFILSLFHKFEDDE